MTQFVLSLITIFLATAAHAQDAPQEPGFMSLMPLVLIFVIFWILIIRPQSKRLKEHSDMVANLKRGDAIVTAGGIHGKISKVNDAEGTLEVEIAKDVNVTVARATVAELKVAAPEAKSEAKKVAAKKPAASKKTTATKKK